jgi:hypothetical protein
VDNRGFPGRNRVPASEEVAVVAAGTAAYQREFSMLEKGKCKTKFPTLDQWYATLYADQRQRVDEVLIAEYLLTGAMLAAVPEFALSKANRSPCL